jgi:diguanylate cyclase (GGDEF)-like protein/PAS domain S-box-containing protein
LSSSLAPDERMSLSAIDHGSGDAIFATRLDGVITAWNGGAQELYGYAATEVLGRDAALLYPEGEVSPIRGILEGIRRGRTSDVVRGARWRADGDLIEVEARYSPVFDESGEVIGVSSIARGVKDRSALEQELNDNRAFYEDAQTIAGFGGWKTDIGPESIMVWTPETHRIMGIAQGVDVYNFDFFNMVHPGDRQLLVETFADVRETGNPAEVELRFTRPDGAERWLLLAAGAQFDPDGAAVGNLGVVRDITEAKEAELRLAHDALHDPLTGLPNRGLFLDRVVLAAARTLRTGSHIAVLCLDLDHFRIFNDARGDESGDELLRAVADRLRAVVRQTDTVTRFGSDEFGLVCENISTAAMAAERAQRYLTAIARPFALEDGDAQITASIGIAVSGPDTLAETMVRDAQLAMHRAKERGRNRFELYDRALRQQVQERASLEGALRRSLDSGELFLDFQPIASLVEARFVGAEALVRWRHAEHGIIQPNDFIPTAEETGLIVPLGKLVLESACRQLRDWRAAAPGNAWGISVNVAATQLRAVDFPDVVEQALEDAGLEGQALCLELTESVLVEEGIVTEVIGRIRALGVRVSIDDFGTKYSSLSYLTRLAIDELKIDQSFVEGIVGDDSKRAVVSAIIAIGEALSLPVTAEGVETEAQLVEVRRLGCESVQGFYLARPVSPEECLLVLQSRPKVPPQSAARSGR